MPYTSSDYPDQLKNLKFAAREKWVEVFNAVDKEQNDEDVARQAAWKIVKDKWPDKSYMLRESLSFKKLFSKK